MVNSAPPRANSSDERLLGPFSELVLNGAIIEENLDIEVLNDKNYRQVTA